MLGNMQHRGVIEKSESPWWSPVILVRKKNGELLVYVGYRKLNDVTKNDCFPLLRVNDTLDTLAGSKWFSALDLKSGYWQVDVHPDDKKNCILDWSRFMAVHSHTLWSLQRSGDI
jgi:hypothetical protein